MTDQSDNPPNIQTVPRNTRAVFRTSGGVVFAEGVVDAITLADKVADAVNVGSQGVTFLSGDAVAPWEWAPKRDPFELALLGTWVPGRREVPWWLNPGSHGYSAGHVENIVGLRPDETAPWYVSFSDTLANEDRQRGVAACTEILDGYARLHGPDSPPVRWWARVLAALL